MKTSHHRNSSASHRGSSTAYFNSYNLNRRRLNFESLEDRRMLAVLTVTNLSDSGADSLREAITTANTSTGVADDIVFQAGLSGTIDLQSQLPTITDDLTITGDNNITLDAGGGATAALGDGFRIFNIDEGTGTKINVEISGLTLTGGDVNGPGGAIYNRENLTVTSSTISGNDAFSFGGGIYNSGNANVTSSTISGNSAAFGGGIGNSGTVNVISSTISANTVSSLGGGIHQSVGVATVTSSTISANTATLYGGGILSGRATATVTSSIVAGNTASEYDNVSGRITGNGFNLIDVDPLLGPLADNGGPTQTHALLPGSPALDAGDPSIQPDANEFDQRGASFVRVAQGLVSGVFLPRIDIGAYEAQGPPLADFDSNLNVNGIDFLNWQRGFGMTSGATIADGDSDDDHDVDASDLAAWQVSYGDVIVVPPLAAAREDSGQKPVGSTELIDAAIIFATSNNESTEPPELIIDRALIETVIAINNGSGNISLPAVETDDTAVTDQPAPTAADVNQPWLDEQLLDRIFG